jgi:hypothetical protein
MIDESRDLCVFPDTLNAILTSASIVPTACDGFTRADNRPGSCLSFQLSVLMFLAR